MAEFAAAITTAFATASTATEVVGAAGSLAVPTFGTAAAAGGTLASAIGATSTVASILAGGATVLSVLSTQRAAEQKAQSLELKASDAETGVGLETAQGLERRNSLKAALVQAVGDRDVAAAASGVDLSFGTPVVARNQAITDGERALSVDQSTEDFRKSRLLESAASYRAMASQARSGGLGAAAALALDGGAKLLRRG